MICKTLMAMGLCLVQEILSASEKISALLPKSGARLRLRIEKLDNGTFLASVIDGQNVFLNDTLDDSKQERDYNDEGAVYYVVAVILMYGFSIILMIGSSVRKNKQDQQAQKYMKEMAKVRRLERRQEKFKTRLLMQNKRIQNILGSVSINKDSAGKNEAGAGDQPPDLPNTSGELNWSLVSRDEGDAGEPLLIIPEQYPSLKNTPDSPRLSFPSQTKEAVDVTVVSDSDDPSGDIGAGCATDCGLYLATITDSSLPADDVSRRGSADVRIQLEPLHEVEEEDEGFV